MSFIAAAIIVMFLVPFITGIIVFGIPSIIKFFREQD